jgi:hypothetical protein
MPIYEKFVRGMTSRGICSSIWGKLEIILEDYARNFSELIVVSLGN